MPRVMHFSSSGDRWAFVIASCPPDYFLKRVLTVCLENKAIVLKLTERGKKGKTSQVIWGHELLKQVKSYICTLLSKWWGDHSLRGLTALSMWHWDALLKDLLYFRRGFYWKHHMHISSLTYLDLGFPTCEHFRASISWACLTHMQRGMEKITQTRLYKQCQYKWQPVFMIQVQISLWYRHSPH